MNTVAGTEGKGGSGRGTMCYDFGMSKPLYKVRVQLEPREDGGLRAWSPDVPQLVLSSEDPALVFLDIPIALEVILSYRFEQPMRVAELVALPAASKGEPANDLREYAAYAA
jgi:hypothetical protein